MQSLILSEDAILFDDLEKNRNFSWLLYTHLNKVDRASCDLLLIPISNQVSISKSDKMVLDSHMVLFAISFKNASIIVYEPLQIFIEYKKFAHIIIDALKFHFPEIKGGSWKFIGDDIWYAATQRMHSRMLDCGWVLVPGGQTCPGYSLA